MCPVFPPADVGVSALCPADSPSPSPWCSVEELSCWWTLMKKQSIVMMFTVRTRQQVGYKL